MALIGRQARHKRNWIGVLLLLPLLLAGLVPQGYMPDAKSDGWFSVTLCTPDGLRTVLLDENGQEVPAPASPEQSDRSSEQCLFATFAALLVDPPASVDTSFAPADKTTWPLLYGAIRFDHLNGLAHARAPPLPV